MALKLKRFVGQLSHHEKIFLDSTVLIYHLEDIDPYAQLTEALFMQIATGSMEAVLSTVSITELLVKPLAEGQDDQVETFEQFLFSIPHAALIPVSYPIARTAAQLRAQYRMRTPDALLSATALMEKADLFISNDRTLRKLSKEGITVLVLDDFV